MGEKKSNLYGKGEDSEDVGNGKSGGRGEYLQIVFEILKE